MYKQKVKHLLYEHQNNISTLKADGELGLKLAGEEAAKREAELQKDCRNLKLELKEQVITMFMPPTVTVFGRIITVFGKRQSVGSGG